jgi:hypothetical protein
VGSLFSEELCGDMGVAGWLAGRGAGSGRGHPQHLRRLRWAIQAVGSTPDSFMTLFSMTS